MKANLQIAAMLVAFGLFTASATISPAQAGKIVGGYSTMSKTDKKVVSAADFAIGAQNEKQKTNLLKLVLIKRAEKQVVAGINYRICLVVSSQGKQMQAMATVYQNLQNKFSLSNWTVGNCDDKFNKTRKSDDNEGAETETVTYKGSLEVGKTSSTILYVGAESGDYAAFCFLNNSEVGSAVLGACKNGEICQFTGKVNFDSPCKVKNLEADLSASGKITSIKSVKALARKTDSGEPKTPTASINSGAPDEIVKNLYAAEKSGASPFFQTKNRALVNKYFTKDFADLIWKDAVTSKGEVGAIDFDPLYHAQDTKITAFVIGKPEYDTGSGSGMATVLVSFKNFGKLDTVKYLFQQDTTKNWKISDIVFRNGDMLKGILFDARTQSK